MVSIACIPRVWCIIDVSSVQENEQQTRLRRLAAENACSGMRLRLASQQLENAITRLSDVEQRRISEQKRLLLSESLTRSLIKQKLAVDSWKEMAERLEVQLALERDMVEELQSLVPWADGGV